MPKKLKDGELKESIKALVVLSREVLRRKRVSLTYLSRELHVSTQIMADQLFFREKIDETLLKKIWLLLGTDIDVNDEAAIERLLTQYGYYYSGTLKPLPKKSQKEFRTCGASFYWMDDPSHRVGSNIKKLREKRRMSPQEFAQLIDENLSEAIVLDWEENNYLPSLTHCITIATIGEVSLDVLLNSTIDERK